MNRRHFWKELQVVNIQYSEKPVHSFHSTPLADAFFEELHHPLFQSIVMEFKHENHEWKVTRTDYEMQDLQARLDVSGLRCLPLCPFLYDQKSGVIMDESNYVSPSIIHIRQWVEKLLSRADIASEPCVANIFSFPMYIKDLVPVRPTLIFGSEENKFSVSDMLYFAESEHVLIVRRDNSGISRLGKLWTVIEPDEATTVTLLSLASENRSFSIVGDTEYNLTSKVMAIAHIRRANKIFLARDEGIISIFDLIIDKSQLKFSCDINAHSCGIVLMTANNSSILSIADDQSLRVISANELEVTNGGSLLTRTKEHGRISCIEAVSSSNLCIFGTVNGTLLFYDISANPPKFVTSFFTNVEKSIGQVLISGCNCFISQANYITCYSINLTPTVSLKRNAEFVLNDTDSRAITRFSVSIYCKLLFACFGDMVAIWSLSHGRCVAAWKAHDAEVTCIIHIPVRNLIVTGAEDGTMKVWSVSSDLC